MEHRLRQSQQAMESVSLAEKFPSLRSLTANLAFYDITGTTRHSEMKYTVNLQHAKSAFFFVCPSGVCVDGDFDLGGKVAIAVSDRCKLDIGEIRCQGWHKEAKIERVPCRMLLRYKLKLNYF